MRDRNGHIDRAAQLLGLLQDDATDLETKEEIRAWFWSGRSRRGEEANDAAMAEYLERLVPNPHPDRIDHKKYRELAARLRIDTAAPISARRKRGLPLVRTVMRAAAVLVLALAVSGVVYMLVDSSRSAAVESPVGEVKVSADSSPRTITLPDGTRVELEAGSEISYSDDFLSDRRVSLDGEALLTVVKSTNGAGEPLPFVLTTDNIEVNVLGTVLRVADYCDGSDEEGDSTVSLYSGSVSIRANDAVTTLKYGERYRYNKTTRESNVALLLAREMLAHGFMPLLRFEESTLENLLTALTANHKVEFVLHKDADLSRGRFSGDLQSEDLSNTLKILTKSNMMHSFELAGDKVFVNKK